MRVALTCPKQGPMVNTIVVIKYGLYCVLDFETIYYKIV